MKAYRIAKIGELDNNSLAISEETVPEPGPKEVLVRVRATSLNRRDLMILRGTYPVRSRPGVIPLSDGAGEVVEIGREVRRVAVGDRVAGTYFVRWLDGRLNLELASEQTGCNFNGMLAEYAVVNEESLVQVPAHLSWEEAATLPCTALTAWSALTGPRPVLPGETVLILGTGGVSLFALQFARLFGARTIVVTSKEAKVEKLRALGATEVLNSTVTPTWEQVVLALTGGRGAEHVVEAVGPATLEQSIKASGFDSQIALMGVFPPEAPDHPGFNPKVLGARLLTIRRIVVGSRAAFTTMNQAITLHRLHPVIDRRFSFSQALEAYRYFDTARPFGKVVISSE